MRWVRVRGGGFVGFLVILAVVAVWARIGLYPFLARHAPAPSDLLVVEGWLPDDALAQAAAWAASNGVKKIIATGGPLETGSCLIQWKTSAEMTQARLEATGMNECFELVAVPAEKVRRGRTRESARALLAAMPMTRGAFTLASEGPHTRRSWRAFQDVFGDGVEVGSLALVPQAYGRDDWWTCSEGVRSVLGETIAYAYDLLPGHD
jgi:hypothetical protein